MISQSQAQVYEQTLQMVVGFCIESGVSLPGGSADGLAWETRFMRLAKGEGFCVSPSERRDSKYDCVVNGLRVQCKNRKRSPRGMVQLRNEPRWASGECRRAYGRDEFDILALCYDEKAYIIPATYLLSEDEKFLCNNIHPHKFSHFIDNWGAFNGPVGKYRPAQMWLWSE